MALMISALKMEQEYTMIRLLILALYKSFNNLYTYLLTFSDSFVDSGTI